MPLAAPQPALRSPRSTARPAPRRGPARTVVLVLCLCLTALVGGASCRVAEPPPPPIGNATRLAAIPSGAVKVTPSMDPVPPVMHHRDWRSPVPLPGPVNSAGAEDSPFISPDGGEFYFFFTPDMSIPDTQQVVDGITGIWYTRRVEGGWSEPHRVMLHDFPCLEGCTAVVGDVLWFAAVRAGNLGEIDIYTARREGDRWSDIRNAGRRLNVDYDIGEFHLTADGGTIYYSAPGEEGYGEMDMWVIRRLPDGDWSRPENLGSGVNTPGWEGQPFVTADGGELWFTGMDRAGVFGTSVWRSLRGPDGSWGTAELIVSNFAGEPCLDAHGNLYFVHHLWYDGKIVEADIYIAEKR